MRDRKRVRLPRQREGHPRFDTRDFRCGYGLALGEGVGEGVYGINPIQRNGMNDVLCQAGGRQFDVRHRPAPLFAVMVWV